MLLDNKRMDAFYIHVNSISLLKVKGIQILLISILEIELLHVLNNVELYAHYYKHLWLHTDTHSACSSLNHTDRLHRVHRTAKAPPLQGKLQRWRRRTVDKHIFDQLQLRKWKKQTAIQHRQVKPKSVSSFFSSPLCAIVSPNDNAYC